MDYEFCVLEDEKDIIEYEKGLFHAFNNKSPNGWLMLNYKIIDNCRLQSYIDYEKLIIYGIKKNDNVIAGGAVNLDRNNLQIEKMGFNIEKINKNEPFVEGINFYVIEDYAKNDFLRISNLFFEFTIKNTIKRGIYVCYGTCSKKLLPLYHLIGWEEVDSIEIDHDIEVLLKYDAAVQDL